MKYLIIFLTFFTSFSIYSQLSVAHSSSTGVCIGDSAAITFYAFGGTGPYTFFYTFNGGATQNVTTTSGNTVTLHPLCSVLGDFSFVLLGVQDSNQNYQSNSSGYTFPVVDQPTIDAGVDLFICDGTEITLNPVSSRAGTITWSTNAIPNSAFAPGLGVHTYTVMLKDYYGCSATDQVDVTVSALPAEPTVTIDSVTCSGGSLAITSNDPYTYLWGNGSNSTTISSLSVGQYHLTETDPSTGCSSEYDYFVPQSLNPGNCGLLASITPPVQELIVGTPSEVTFTAINGVAPYTFNYSIAGGAIQSITTSTNSISINTTKTFTSFFFYTLVSIEDANLDSVGINQTVHVKYYNPVVVDAGPDKVACPGYTFYTVATMNYGSYYWLINGNNVGSSIPLGLGLGVYECIKVYTLINDSIATDTMIFTVQSTMPPPNVSITSPSCSGGGSITFLNPTSGWLISPAMPSFNNLAAGTYPITIMDQYSGCTGSFEYVILPSQSLICGEISGHVTYDANANCQTDTIDSPIQNRVIVANPGNYSTLTDAMGNYVLELPYGTYTVTEVQNTSTLTPSCTVSYSVNLTSSSSSVTGIDFYDTANVEFDLQANLYCSAIVAGFESYVHLNYNNVKPFEMLSNQQGWFVIPQDMTLVSWDHPYTQSNDTLYFNVGNLNSFVSTIVLSASTSLLGNVVTLCGGIDVDSQETNISNNQVCLIDLVVGSYDPNHKTMFLNGEESDSTILLADSKLDYVVHFQNTGTAPAQNIYVLDTLSSHLDLTSFEFVSSSHNCQVSFLDGGVLKFNFPQIFLPDSTIDVMASQGYFHFRICQKVMNQEGDVIKNTAYIYFDFNDPIVTNTTFDSIISLQAFVDEFIQICSDVDSVSISGSITEGAEGTWTSTGSGIFESDNTLVTHYFPSQSDALAGQVFLILHPVDLGGNSVISDTILLSINMTTETDAGEMIVSCAGDEVVLTATGANHFEWDQGVENGVAFQPPLGLTLYTVIGSDVATGCFSTDTVSVLVHDTPQVSFDLGLDTLCLDDPVLTLSGGLPVGGNYSGLGVSNGVLNPAELSVGNYSIQYQFETEFGCGDSITVDFVLDSCSLTYLEELPDFTFSTFPNPNEGEFTVYVKSNSPNYLLQIIDLTGKTIYEEKESKEMVKIKLKDKKSGIYFVKITTSDTSASMKVVVN